MAIAKKGGDRGKLSAKADASEPAKGAAGGRVVDVTALVKQGSGSLASSIEAYRAVLAQGRKALPRVTSLTKDERKYTAGKIGAAEFDELDALLDVVDEHEGVFASIAAKDHGSDPRAVETEPARQALGMLRELAPLVAQLREATSEASDLALRLGEIVRDVTTPAYKIATANAPVNDALRADLAKITDKRKARRKPGKPRKTP